MKISGKRIVKATIAFLFLFFLVPLNLHANDEATNQYPKGLEAYNNGDYETAILSFEKTLKLLDINPTEAGEKNRKLLQDMENTPNDLDKPRRVVAFLKEWLDSYYYLGLAYAHKGEKTAALKQVADLRTIGRNDYADSLESEINRLIK